MSIVASGKSEGIGDRKGDFNHLFGMFYFILKKKHS
jgi:hypothetical protein